MTISDLRNAAADSGAPGAPAARRRAPPSNAGKPKAKRTWRSYSRLRWAWR